MKRIAEILALLEKELPRLGSNNKHCINLNSEGELILTVWCGLYSYPIQFEESETETPAEFVAQVLDTVGAVK